MKPTDPPSPSPEDLPKATARPGPAWHRPGSDLTPPAGSERQGPLSAEPDRVYAGPPGPVPRQVKEGYVPTASHGHGDHGHGHVDDELQNEGVAHEESDVNVRAILSFAAIVVAVSVVCAVIVWGMFRLFESQAEARETNRSPLARPSTQMPAHTTGSPFFGAAPSPQLLTNEPEALRQLREAEAKTLHTYGWVDERAGVARLPIEEAKKVLAGRGLPSRATGVDPVLGTHAPAYGEATGGRSIPSGRVPAGGAQGGQPPPPAPEPAPAPQAAPEHTPAGRGGGA